MKLYELKRGDKFTAEENAAVPPGALHTNTNKIYKLHNLDGMYSYCTDENGTVFHIAAFSDVFKVD